MDHLPQTALEAFLSGQRDSAEATHVRRHLEECGRCRARLARLSDLDDDFKTEVGAPPREDAGAKRSRDRRVGDRRSGGSNAGSPDTPLARGVTLGRYLILEKIGEGGMGQVYAAYDPELDRKVAVKVLTPSVIESFSQDRLLREAQAMARVANPNVIAVHDVGTLDGRIFVAMELVEGGTLDHHMRKESPTWKSLLTLFIQAGRGLAAAHEAGLVHRDFKPENVLLGPDGRARVTDFGLARLAVKTPQAPAPPSGEAPPEGGGKLAEVLTQVGVVMGTPQYMAPEHQLGQTPDARSDQFSFCASLYWALYRQRPFDPLHLVDAAVRSRHAPTRAERPSRPVTLSSPIREPPRDVHVSPHVRRAVLRGLSVDPEDRFPSMDALLAELERDPAAKRRKLSLAAGAFALVILVALGYQQAIDGRRQLCTGAPARLAGVWDGAVREAVEARFLATGTPYAAESVERVTRRMDERAAAWGQMHREACEATRIRGEQDESLLSLRMICLDRRLQEMEALTRVLQEADVQVVQKSADAVISLSSLSACADLETLASKDPLPDDPGLRASIAGIEALLQEAKALRDSGKPNDALPIAARAAAQARGLDYRPIQAEAFHAYGWLLGRTGRAEEGEALLEEAVWAAEAGRHELEKAEAASRLVYMSGYTLGRIEDGRRWAELSRAAIERLGGDEPLEVQLYTHLGILAFTGQELELARTHFEDALRRADRALPEHDTRRVNLLVNLASLGLMQDRTAEARPMAEGALRSIEQGRGPNHPSAAYAHNVLARIVHQLGDLDTALEHVRAAVRIWRASLGGSHATLADGLDHLATIHLAREEPAAALVAAREAVELRERVQGVDHPDLAYSLDNLGQALLRLGRASDAISPLERSLRSGDRTPGEIAESRFALARALTLQRRSLSRARRLAREAVAAFRREGLDGRVIEVERWLARGEL